MRSRRGHRARAAAARGRRPRSSSCSIGRVRSTDDDRSSLDATRGASRLVVANKSRSAGGVGRGRVAARRCAVSARPAPGIDALRAAIVDALAGSGARCATRRRSRTCATSTLLERARGARRARAAPRRRARPRNSSLADLHEARALSRGDHRGADAGRRAARIFERFCIGK